MKLKVAVGVLVLIILAFTVFGDRGLLNLVRYQQERQELLSRAQKLREENRELRAEIERLQNDPAHIERLAREELGMVKPGELVIQFSEDPGKEAPGKP
ncbi:MAG TPA: septum formation initiator family protein [bacterium]|nr:septum formation initiator family protein [bacterium]